MRQIKIRYTFKRKSDGHIWQEIVPIECLEGKGDRPFILNDWQQEWELIARDFFTGLPDKNDNDIYEGDIVNSEYFNHAQASTFIKQVVDFEKGTFTLKSQDIELEMTRQNVPIHWADTIEIIGNIHSNPELLQK